ncbi:MAG: transglycosylase SLT domain-containing protein [Peptococcaceae bacterium]|nr:transglycosylase SLT domain-containing protein [Peptococcaceae bacterium]
MGTQTYSSEKIKCLAAKYNVNSEYLNYIIKVEKKFNLQPCELLALIAQESGFKPQTRMDGGSLSYSTTQMKLPAAITAYKAITEYYNMEIPYPTDELLKSNEYYAALLAGGYLRYLNDTYNNNKYESYSAYNLGIGGKNQFYKRHGHYKSSYAVKVASLGDSFAQYIGPEYFYQDSDETDNLI